MRPLTLSPMLAVVGGPCAGGWVVWSKGIGVGSELALDDQDVSARSEGPVAWCDPTTAAATGKVVYRVVEVSAELGGADRMYLVPR